MILLVSFCGAVKVPGVLLNFYSFRRFYRYVVVVVLKVGSSAGYGVTEVLQVTKKFQGLLSSSSFSRAFVLGVIKKVLEVVVFHSGFTQSCVCVSC